MFPGDFDDPDKLPPTTSERFELRIDRYRAAKRPTYVHHFWWFMHNAVAHPLIAVLPLAPAFRFHDYTAAKINLVKP